MAFVGVDYSSRLRSAEEEIATYIDGILTEGGHMLWQKYLQRKAFPFAAETATEALTASLRMCFVAHDAGESDNIEDWTLEDEPEPGEVDSWARMHLAVRRPRRGEHGDDTMHLGNRGRGDPFRRNQTMRARVSDARGRPRGQGRSGDKTESRSYPIQEEYAVDEEEEKLREAKQQEEARRRDKENKVRAAEKAKEEEQRRVQALHEEMARKQHTFDSEGNIIWVEEIKLERLPKVQEMFPYGIKKDPRSKDRLEETMGTGKAATSPAAKKAAAKSNARRKLRFDRSSRANQNEEDFPDGFSKLQHGQPPILETMVVKPGVVLDSNGKQKAGPAVNQGGGMSRKEYVAWTEKEGAFEAQFAQGTSGEQAEGEGADGAANGAAPGGAPGAPPGAAPGAPGTDPAATAGSTGPGTALPGALGAQGATDRGLGDTLPPIQPGRGNASMGGGGGRSTGSKSGGPAAQGDKVEAQKAPSAPPMHVRQKKMEAVGHLGRPPRLHVAPLGGPYGFSAAQPPLGATMGHGLLRSGSAKEAFFFPSRSPEMPDLLRSASEAMLPREKSFLSAPGSQSELRAASREALGSAGGQERHHRDEEEHARRHGIINPERKSPAYRGVRHALFPHAGDTGLEQYGAVYT